MIDHYQDIVILPNPEFPVTTVMNAMYAKLHREFVHKGNQNIGVSFPLYSEEKPIGLGNILRLHGSQTDLENLATSDWLKGIRDMVELHKILSVPPAFEYWSVKRIQAKSNPYRDRERLMRRQHLSEEEAYARIPDSAAERLNLPFVTLNSQSTKQQFRLFIRQATVTQQAIGMFNTYGLSQTATLPKF